jgi:hypothetical protein
MGVHQIRLHLANELDELEQSASVFGRGHRLRQVRDHVAGNPQRPNAVGQVALLANAYLGLDMLAEPAEQIQ